MRSEGREEAEMGGAGKERSTEQGRALRFQRRAVLKMMAAAPVAGLMPMRALGLDDSRAAQPGSVVSDGAGGYWKLETLTPHEWRTVTVLGEWIVPADEVSGSATDAGVPAFIDDWLKFQGGPQVLAIREGLAWLDGECVRLYRADFVRCTTEQQEQMLDRIAWPEKAAAGDAKGVLFFNQLRDLVLSGFYTSEMGRRDLPYVGNQPQKAWWGCPPAALEKLGV